MKITKQQLKQIIKEELRSMPQYDDEDNPASDAADMDNYADAYERELSFEDRDKFVEAYTDIEKAVESGTLPESVEDAVFDMLGKLGINL